MKHGTTHAYGKGCRCTRCRDAKSAANARQRVLADLNDPIELKGGSWVPRDGIMRWEKAGEHTPASKRGGPKPVALMFPQDERRTAHNRYWAGDRSPATVVGEREYQRDAKRRARAARRAMGSDVA